MKIKFRLSFWLISIMAVVVTAVTIVLIRQTSGISYYLSVRNLGQLTSQRVEFWKGQEDGNIRTLHALANIMSDYESIKAEERRDRFNDMLRSTLEAESQMTAVYTVWKPYAVDDMDSRFIGKTGSGPTGQYAMAYFKEAENITGKTSGDIENVIRHISGPNADKDRVDNPALYKIQGKNVFIVRMAVPIINRRTNKVVGSLGCFVSVDNIQNMIENTMKANNEIAMMALYSGNGTILAHYIPERIGKRMLDVDMELGDARKEMFRAMQTGKPYMDTLYQPSLNKKIIFIMKPFQIGNSRHNWSMLIGVPESYILKEIKGITRFIITLIVITFLGTALIVFVVIGFITKPIIGITERLKDLSKGEGDLTQLLPEKGNDEITDMSRYFNLTLKKIKNFIIGIKQQAAVLSDTGNELSGNMTRTASVITQINSSLKIIKSRLIDQDISTTQTAEIMEQIICNIDGLKENVEKQVFNATKSLLVIEDNINNAMKENEDSKNISMAVSRFDEINRSVNNESTDIQEGSMEAAMGSRRVGLAVEQIAAEINEVAAGADQINSALEKANEISERNRKNINLLVRGASMFKVA